MRYQPQLQAATLIRRYKRFLADVEWPDGRVETVHTPNTGAMLGCAEAGMRVWLFDTQDPKRKYRYSWVLSESSGGVLIGVNTGIQNRIATEAIEQGVIRELQGYRSIRQEVRYGDERSRIDLLLEGHPSRPECYVELKSVTARDDAGNGFFPDAVSIRASKHLRELIRVAEQGGRAVNCFCVQRSDVKQVRPADEIDPDYGKTMRMAFAAGVEMIAYAAAVSPEGVELVRRVPVVFPENSTAK